MRNSSALIDLIKRFLFLKFYKGILDPEMAKKHAKMIDDKMTHDITYYSKIMTTRDDHGTAHVAIIAENGDAVSTTGSLNEKYVACGTILQTK